jgi:hypothetical protein
MGKFKDRFFILCIEDIVNELHFTKEAAIESLAKILKEKPETDFEEIRIYSGVKSRAPPACHWDLIVMRPVELEDLLKEKGVRIHQGREKNTFDFMKSLPPIEDAR